MSTLLESEKFPALLERFNTFWGKIGKSCAKITKNWKLFEVIIFENEMVQHFVDC